MRIVSGKYKGIRITAPKKLPARPTTDMAKEALFNILNNNYYFEDVVVLDLFSGIGSIGIEFASRGTKDITSVDIHKKSTYFLTEISNKYDLDLNVINGDVYRFLEKNVKQYDIIFADPPYNFSQEEFEKIINLVFDKSSITDRGTLIIEHSKKTNLSNSNYFVKLKKYGGSCFSFFEIKKMED